MKFLDKLVLKIFSLIILALIILISLILFGVIRVEFITEQIIHLTDGRLPIKVIIGILAVFVLFALKGLFFTSKPENTGKDGIILENSNGKLLISKESLENLIASVIKEIPGADSVSSRTVLDRDRNLIVYVTAVVSKDIMIKDVSNDIQAKVKEAMKKTADLDVKEVNIKIKNITNKKVKGLPAADIENAEITENTEKNLDELNTSNSETIDSENVENNVVEE